MITPERDKKQLELSKEILAELDKASASLGVAFVDRLCKLEDERKEWREFQYYRSGFILGARPILEALGPGL